MNDLYFKGKNKKGSQGRNYPSKPILCYKTYKKGQKPLFGNKKAIILIFFVSILWFLYGRDDRTRTCGIVLPKHARYQLRHISEIIKLNF